MTFDEYCTVRQEPNTWRAKWLRIKDRWEQWKRQKQPLFLVRYPLFGFAKPIAYYKADRLNKQLALLERMAGIGDPPSSGSPNICKTLGECELRAAHIIFEVRKRKEERKERQKKQIAKGAAA